MPSIITKLFKGDTLIFDCVSGATAGTKKEIETWYGSYEECLQLAKNSMAIDHSYLMHGKFCERASIRPYLPSIYSITLEFVDYINFSDESVDTQVVYSRRTSRQVQLPIEYHKDYKWSWSKYLYSIGSVLPIPSQWHTKQMLPEEYLIQDAMMLDPSMGEYPLYLIALPQKKAKRFEVSMLIAKEKRLHKDPEDLLVYYNALNTTGLKPLNHNDYLWKLDNVATYQENNFHAVELDFSTYMNGIMGDWDVEIYPEY